MASPVIQFKRGAFANLPALQAGEPALTTDTHELYVGLNSTSAGNKFFGSHRYWTREAGTTGSGVNLVEGTDNGTQYVTIKSPNSLSGIVTFTFPGTDGSNGHILKTDGSGNLSFGAPAASDFTIAGDSGSDTFSTGGTLTFTGGEGIDTAITDDTVTISAEDASTSNKGVASFLSTDFSVSSGEVSIQAERIQDIAGAMFGGNTETLITATYQDSDGTIDLVVDNDLANYDNTNTAFVTADGSATLTNKTFDANGTGNSLSNVEVADFAAAAIVNESEGIGSNDNDTTIPTSAAVKDFVDTSVAAIDLTLSTAGDSGSGSVATSQTLTVAGTANEIETSVSSQTVTIGLPNTVNITTQLDVPTVEATNLKARDGTAAITISDSTGAVALSQNLTVAGNLIVNGSTTQVNTSQTTIEDQLLELGMVDGSAPGSDLNKDIGVIFNYYTSSAKKAAVYWDDSTSRIVIAGEVSESSGVLTNDSAGALEVGSLYVNDCAGNTQVINCSGTTRSLENISIDGGSF